MFKAVITQGCEAGRAPECVNSRGWEVETFCGELTAAESQVSIFQREPQRLAFLPTSYILEA